MCAEQINSFVGKFVSLWSLGSEVSLKFNAVAFELDLGQFQSLKSSNVHADSKHFPSSRQRRRDRKFHESFDLSSVKEADKPLYDNNATERNDIVHDEVQDTNLGDSKEVVSKSCSDQISADVQIAVMETCNYDENDKQNAATMDSPKTESDVFTANAIMAPGDEVRETESFIESVVNSDNETTESTPEPRDQKDVVNVNVSKESVKDANDKKTYEVTVHVKVNFENCQSQKLYQEHLQTIQEIVHRNDHLRKNVQNIEIRESEHCYDHDIWIKLKVDSSHLWESARTYIWKHLGQQEWKLGDGTTVTANRIHVKY